MTSYTEYLALWIQSTPARSQGQSQDQFEINLEFDSAEMISDTVKIYFLNGDPCAWYDSETMKAGW